MTPIAYTLLVAGAALALGAAVRVMMTRINVDVFLAALLKLIAADNRDRARKLCAAASIAPFGRIAGAILDAAARAPADLGPDLAADSMRDAFTRSRGDELRSLRRLGLLALLGALIAAAGMATAVHVGLADLWLFGPAPIAAGLMLWTWRAIQRTHREVARAAPRLIEALTPKP